MKQYSSLGLTFTTKPNIALEFCLGGRRIFHYIMRLIILYLQKQNKIACTGCTMYEHVKGLASGKSEIASPRSKAFFKEGL